MEAIPYFLLLPLQVAAEALVTLLVLEETVGLAEAAMVPEPQLLGRETLAGLKEQELGRVLAEVVVAQDLLVALWAINQHIFLKVQILVELGFVAQ
jgi:hypothetical protein